MRIPTYREPTHSGEILLEEFLIPMGLTQKTLAEAIQVSYQRMTTIGWMALRLSTLRAQPNLQF